MTIDEITSAVKKTVISVLGAPVDAHSIQTSASYKEDLGLDSLAILEIAVEVERVFEIEVPEEELEQVVTIGDTVALVGRYLDMKEKVELVKACDDGLLSPA